MSGPSAEPAERAAAPPPPVRTALRLMWALWFAMTAWLAHAGFQVLSNRVPGATKVATFYTFVVVLAAVLVSSVGRGANRARWLYAAYAALASADLMLDSAFTGSLAAVGSLAALLLAAGHVAAVILLFQRPANDWFKAPRGPAPTR